MQTKTTKRFYFILTRIFGIRKSDNNKHWQRIEILETTHTAGENVK